ncbi:MAG: hypothetical protein ACXVY9_09190 [Terriglobales bacterium]
MAIELTNGVSGAWQQGVNPMKHILRPFSPEDQLIFEEDRAQAQGFAVQGCQALQQL